LATRRRNSKHQFEISDHPAIVRQILFTTSMKPLALFSLRSTTVLTMALGLACAPVSRAQDPKPVSPTEASAAVSPELEAKFIATLTDATFKGRWSPITDGQLGPEKEESYLITSVTKVGGDKWTINARLSYAGQSLVLPIPAQVKWAGDTPVLILDQLTLGVGPTYSARVMIYDKTYAGTWSGGGKAGMLNGLIANGK